MPQPLASIPRFCVLLPVFWHAKITFSNIQRLNLYIWAKAPYNLFLEEKAYGWS